MVTSRWYYRVERCACIFNSVCAPHLWAVCILPHSVENKNGTLKEDGSEKHGSVSTVALGMSWHKPNACKLPPVFTYNYKGHKP